MEKNKIYCDDCLNIMPDISDKSIDMILCDLPYGTTACKWDVVIPFELLWKQYKRIIKDNGAIVLFGSQPFTTILISSNIKMFRHEWIWKKTKASGFQLANKIPMKGHENILVFYKRLPTYNPQKVFVGIKDRRKTYNKTNPSSNFPIASGKGQVRKDDGYRFPVTVQEFSNSDKTKRLHPTQKPVALFEYLIKTYTNKGDLVLDNCAGSGTTGVACKNLGRDYILIEKEEKYVEIARNRIKTILASLF